MFTEDALLRLLERQENVRLEVTVLLARGRHPGHCRPPGGQRGSNAPVLCERLDPSFQQEWCGSGSDSVATCSEFYIKLRVAVVTRPTH